MFDKLCQNIYPCSWADLGETLDPGESEAEDDETEETEDPHHENQDQEPGVVGGDSVMPN